MRNSKPIDAISIAISISAVVILFVVCSHLPPRLDENIPAKIGESLAVEAVSLLRPGGRITIITRDTQAFPQPALDVSLKSFYNEVHRTGASVASVHRLQLDPLRPVEVPPGDFYEFIRRLPPENVIVSFLGPPVLTEEQKARLGEMKPKIVAFCSGNLSEVIDPSHLFSAGLLHVAMVSRLAANSNNVSDPPKRSSFDQLYTIVRAKKTASL
jgi:hypothetical protein